MPSTMISMKLTCANRFGLHHKIAEDTSNPNPMTLQLMGAIGSIIKHVALSLRVLSN